MSGTRILMFFTILAAIALTGAKVSALWPQQDGKSMVSEAPPLNLPKASEVVLAAASADDPMLQKLNARLTENPEDFEASLLKGLVLFQSGDLSAAITVLGDLTRRAPKFQLAHLIFGDLLVARFGLSDPFNPEHLFIGADSAQKAKITRLKNEARARLLGYLSLIDNAAVPDVLLRLGPDTQHALVVDKNNNRLYVFRNAGPGLPPELVDDFYIVLGKVPGDKLREGDLKTPNGVYFVTSYLADEQLPPLYGHGAFPVNYPNEFDRRLRKTGQGIWLHGTDKSLYSRPPLDSEGCVVLTNREFEEISKYVEVGRTPVVISEKVNWLSSSEWLEENIEIQSAIETWRQSWEEADISGYLEFYSDDFWAGQHDEKSWASYKKRVFAGKTFQKINFSDLSLFGYPQTALKTPVVVANFRQHYRSNNFNGDMHKRLYMVKERGGWRILYEGRQSP